MTPARWLAVLLPALALGLAWPALNGQFLSDDIGIMHWLLRWDAAGALWSSVFAKFAAGLDVPNHYYRPLALLTYALDQRLFGWSPLGWHLTGFAIHLGNAVLVGAIARALGGDGLRSVTAAGLFLLFPLAPEVSIWFAGRYDVLALSGMLIAVYGHLRATGFDRWRALSLFGFVLGLTAKEAAMPTPGLLVLASLLRSAPGELLLARLLRCARETWPVIALFFAYLGLRVVLFGSALEVYPGSDPGAAISVAEIARRLLALTVIPRAVFADALLAGALALAAMLLATLLALREAWHARNVAAQWLLPAAWLALSLLSLVPHLSGVLEHGEGGRFYYASGAWLALLMAGAVSPLRRRAATVAALLMLAAFAVAQQHALAQWARAGDAMAKLLPQLSVAAASLGDDEFALVVVPDHIGPVPFARNAQGGIVMPPQQTANLLPRLVPLLPEAIATWPQRIADGDVARIKQRDIAPRLDAVFCFDPAHLRLHRAEQAADWREPEAFLRDVRHFTRSACAL
ncbi:MAG: hypothetical protein IPG63_05865 [Xanthomonadales bacterium]|nr:hypothetical protein [Xanthomonadales bacterium]MCC6562648.1 hypothetical protein [Xanthomonadales bacterium]